MLARVKICGITRADDALLAQELGATALGFVFWPGSPRCVDAGHARAIIARLAPAVLPVGVFVDQPVEEVRRVVREAGLGAVQLHGGEDPAAYDSAGAPVIKAVQVGEGAPTDAALALPRSVTVLLDAHDPVRKGGTGRTIDWAAAAAVARERPIILAGGLHAGNAAGAIARVRPYMVDLSSGVESAPGLKDPEKLRALFRALEAA